MVQYFNFVNSIRQSEYIIASSKYELDVHFRKWSYLRKRIVDRHFGLILLYFAVCYLILSQIKKTKSC